MSAATASKLDTDRFRKVHRLMTGGATAGERKAATARAEAMASRAGMTLKQAVSSLDSQPKPTSGPTFADIFADIDDRMEAKHPGYKARKAAEAAAQAAQNAVRRDEIRQQYGSEKAVLDRTEWERQLEVAVTPLATWDHWTDNEGVRHRFASKLDGRKPDACYWYVEDITPSIRAAVMCAYPWPSNLGEVLREVKSWDRLSRDRCLIDGHEWEHYAEVQCRVALLEEELKGERPAATWDDVQARFDWKRWEFSRQWLDPQEPDDPFMDRLEADIAALRATNPLKEGQSAEEGPQYGHPLPRTTAEKRAAVLSMLDEHPELSDREIGRRLGVSPTTVGTLRKKQKGAQA